MTERCVRRWRWLPLLVALLPLGGAVADVNVSGSAYVDYWSLWSAAARGSGLASVTPEVALKVEADAHETLSFSGRACFGCHGLEVDRAHLDFTPTEAFNLQVGRIGVPFGDFSQRYDPAGHRAASKPLIYEMGRMAYYGRDAFNLGVLPMPYVEMGAVAYGQVWLGEAVQLWYGGYVVAGMKGENDLDFSAMRVPFYTDNNREPAGGGRFVLTVSGQEPEGLFRDVSLGVSGMYGRYDRGARRAYRVGGVDGSLRLGRVTVRGEVALVRLDIDPAVPGYRYRIVDPFIDKGGFYFEVEHPLGPALTVLYRVDGLRRAGVPLPQSLRELSPDSRVLRYTQGLQVQLGNSFFTKLSYEYWRLTDFPSFHSAHVGVGGAF